MKYKNLIRKEDGYLLLDSLLTLTILMAVITLLSPLTVDWLARHREAKGLVEVSRQLYEGSIMLNSHQPKQQGAEEYTVEIDRNCIRIKETGIEVIIYDSVFKK